MMHRTVRKKHTMHYNWQTKYSRTIKKRDFSKFCKIAEIVKEGKHLKEEGIRKIIEIRREMNDGGKRKYSEKEILRKIQESSETIRQKP